MKLPSGCSRWLDLILALALFGSAFACALSLAQMIEPALLTERKAKDVWFDGDMRRIVTTETQRFNAHSRSNIHPLASTLLYTPVTALRKVLGWPVLACVQVFHALIAGAWAACFFLLLRRFGCRCFDSLVFTGVALTSASFVFWCGIPEGFLLGSLSMFPGLYLAADRNAPKVGRHIAAQMVALSVTVTNWAAPVLATWLSVSRRRFFVVTALSLVGLLVATKIQELGFPSTRLPMDGVISGNKEFLFMPEAGGFLPFALNFIFHGITAPGISWLSNHHGANFPLMSFRLSPLFSGPWMGWISNALWAALLGMALSVFFDRRRLNTVVVAVGLTLLAQVVLHSMYGRETFLYTPHFVPLLVILCALVTLTRARKVALVLALLLIPFNAANNWAQYRWCAAYTGRYPILQQLLVTNPEERIRLDLTFRPKQRLVKDPQN